MTYEEFDKVLKEFRLNKKEFAKLTNMSYTGVTNWNQRNQTPAWVDSWLENYEKANKYDFLIRLVAEYIGVKELMLLKDKNGGGK